MISEKQFEDIICKYSELIEEGLVFKGRQVRVYGKIMDILFDDKFRQKLIVELKIGPIDRKHIGQVMEYEGSILSIEDPTARIILVGNRVPPNLRKALDHHGIEWKEITISKLQEFLRNKNDIEFLKSFQEETSVEFIKNKKIISSELSLNKNNIGGTDRKVNTILFSTLASHESIFIAECIEHLKNKKSLYWAVGFNIDKSKLIFPIVGYIHLKGKGVRYRALIDDIIPHKKEYYLGPNATEFKPKSAIENFKINIYESNFRNELIISRLEKLPHFLYYKEIKKINGKQVLNAPQGYIRIIDPENSAEFRGVTGSDLQMSDKHKSHRVGGLG